MSKRAFLGRGGMRAGSQERGPCTHSLRIGPGPIYPQPPPPLGVKAGAEVGPVFVPCVFVIGSWRPGKELTEASRGEASAEVWTPGMVLYIETTGYLCPGQSILLISNHITFQ